MFQFEDLIQIKSEQQRKSVNPNLMDPYLVCGRDDHLRLISCQ